MVRGTAITTVLTVLTILAALTPFPCLAGLHGDLELLKTVALRHKANFESLVTWKGEAFEEVLGTWGDNRTDYMLRNNCTFAYDRLQSAARWNKEPQENRFVVNGESLRDIRASFNSAMVKDQSAYEFSATGQRDGKDTFHLVINDLRKSQTWENYGLDPRSFFADPGGQQPFYDRLMWMYDNADLVKAASNVLHLKRVGNLVTVETWMPEHKCTQKYVFDLSVGGNLIAYSNESPNAETVQEYQYEQQSGVWVPKSYNYANITGKQKGAGALKSTRTIRWSKSVVNVPFEEDEFTVEKLGIKPGDDIHDRTTGILYTYRGYLTDSEMLKALDTADMPAETTISDNDGSSEATSDGETVTNKQDANEAETVEERDIIQTLETIPAKHGTDGKRTPATYVIVVVLVIGLAGIAMLSRRLR